MKKLLIGSCLILALSVFNQVLGRAKFQDYAQKGGKNVQVTTTLNYKLMETFPSSTITVYITGTLTLAPIYSDTSGTPKANPFTANTDAFYSFYADNGIYDIRFSGTGITTPFTKAEVSIFDPDDITNAYTFGATGKGGITNTGSINSGTNILNIGTVPNNPYIFDPSVVGMKISIRGANSGDSLTATITNYNSPTSVTLSVNATSTVSNSLVAWSIDCTSILSNLITYVESHRVPRLVFPKGVFLTSNGIDFPSHLIIEGQGGAFPDDSFSNEGFKGSAIVLTSPNTNLLNIGEKKQGSVLQYIALLSTTDNNTKGIRAAGTAPNSSFEYTIHNCYIKGFDVGVSVEGISDWQFDDFHFYDNTIIAKTYGIYVNTANADYWKVTNNKISLETSSYGIYAESFGDGEFDTNVVLTTPPLIAKASYRFTANRDNIKISGSIPETVEYFLELASAGANTGVSIILENNHVQDVKGSIKIGHNCTIVGIGNILQEGGIQSFGAATNVHFTSINDTTDVVNSTNVEINKYSFARSLSISTTNTSPTISGIAGTFVSDDVGRYIEVATNVNVPRPFPTILAVSGDGSSATISSNATATGSTSAFVYTLLGSSVVNRISRYGNFSGFQVDGLGNGNGNLLSGHLGINYSKPDTNSVLTIPLSASEDTAGISYTELLSPNPNIKYKITKPNTTGRLNIFGTQTVANGFGVNAIGLDLNGPIRPVKATLSEINSWFSLDDGMIFYCTDCNKGTTPCTSGGSGSRATRENGATNCN